MFILFNSLLVYCPSPSTLRSLTLTSGLSPTPNKRVSGSATFGCSDPNPSLRSGLRIPAYRYTQFVHGVKEI